MFVSTSWATPEPLREAMRSCDGWVVAARPVDWGMGRWHHRYRHLRDGMTCAWHALREGSVVVMTSTLEVYVAAAVLRLLPMRRSLIVVDFLCPRSTRLRRLQSIVLKRVDLWLVIRRGDIDYLAERFGLDVSRFRFIHFPSSLDPTVEDQGTSTSPRPRTVYAAGQAHRDWTTFFGAVEGLDAEVTVSTTASSLSGDDAVIPDNVEVIDLLSPEDGRARASASAVVVMPMLDTPLPSGPVVLADALMMGCAVVATDVNGTRDYVEHGRTGWLVPARDTEALRAAVASVLDKPELRAEVASAARAFAKAQLTPEAFAGQVDALFREWRRLTDGLDPVTTA